MARSSPMVLLTALTLGAAAMAACDSPGPSAPSLGAAPAFDAGAGTAMGQSVLLVGNFQPGGADNGILRYDRRGRFIDKMVPVGSGGLTIACCMAFGPDDNLYVGSPLTSSVLRYNGITGAFIDEFVHAGSGGLVVPLIPVFRNGILYLGDLATHSIRRYDARTGAPIGSGAFIELAPQGTGQGDPQHFVFGPDGHVYVASVATNRVLRYNGITGVFMDVVVPDDANATVSPSGLTFGPDGYLYVGSDVIGEVRRYDVVRRSFVDVFVTPHSGGLDGVVGVLFGPDGNLYVASTSSGEVLRYDGRTGDFMDAFVPAGRGGIDGPRMIAFKSSMTICHRPPGNPANGTTMTHGYMTAREHVAHGDAVGACR